MVFYSIFVLIITKISSKTRLFSMFALFYQKPYQKGCFCLFLFYILTKAQPQRVFFSYFALNLTKALPQRFSPILPLFSPKPYQLRVFYLYFCSNSNSSQFKKGVFLYFSPYSNNIPAKKDVFPSCCHNFTQSPTTKCFFSIFVLILHKALPKRVFFSIFCYYSYQSPTKKFFSFLLLF